MLAFGPTLLLLNDATGDQLVRHSLHLPFAGSLPCRLLLGPLQYYHHLLYHLHPGEYHCAASPIVVDQNDRPERSPDIQGECALLTACSALQGLVGVTLSAGVPALHDGQHGINQSSFFIGMLYIVALGAHSLTSNCLSPWRRARNINGCAAQARAPCSHVLFHLGGEGWACMKEWKGLWQKEQQAATC
jgi:hypothetical protein